MISRSNGATFEFQKSKMVANFATALPIDVMFGSRVGFLARLRFIP